MRILKAAGVLFGILSCILMPATAFADTSFTQLESQLEQQYGLPAGILSKVAYVESSGNPNAGSPAHAYGLFQWLPNSWESASKALFGQPLDPSLRTSPDLSAKVTAFALADTKSKIGGLITQANVDMTVGLYLGHFLGIAGAQHFLTAYIQNAGGSACSIFPKECAANPSILSGRTLAGVINLLASRLGSAGVPNVPGNFQDSSGTSYAYSSADVSAGNFLPANTVIGVDPQYDYAPVYTSVASQQPAPISSAISSLPQTIPNAPQTTPPASYTTPPQAATALAADAAASTSNQCTPQYSCTNNTVYYQSNSCSTSVFQNCQYGCDGTICAPAPASAAASTSVTATVSPISLFTSNTAGNILSDFLATSTSIGTATSFTLGGGLLSVVQEGTATPLSSQAQGQSEATGSTYSGDATGSGAFDGSIYLQNDFAQTSSYGGSYSAPASPFSQLLNQLKSTLAGFLGYLQTL